MQNNSQISLSSVIICTSFISFFFFLRESFGFDPNKFQAQGHFLIRFGPCFLMAVGKGIGEVLVSLIILAKIIF